MVVIQVLIFDISVFLHDAVALFFGVAYVLKKVIVFHYCSFTVMVIIHYIFHHHHQYNRIHSQPVPVNKCDLKNYSSNSKRKTIIKKPRVSISTKANTDLYNGNLKPNSFN